MDKKIITLCILFLIVMAITITYVASYQLSLDGNQQGYTSTDGDVPEGDISNEIDQVFIDEDDEVEIGRMI